MRALEAGRRSEAIGARVVNLNSQKLADRALINLDRRGAIGDAFERCLAAGMYEPRAISSSAGTMRVTFENGSVQVVPRSRWTTAMSPAFCGGVTTASRTFPAAVACAGRAEPALPAATMAANAPHAYPPFFKSSRSPRTK